jgi:hypothetical protein
MTSAAAAPRGRHAACPRLLRVEAGSSWPVACSSCAGGVTLASSLRLLERGFDGGRRQTVWVAVGDAELRRDVEGRFHRCAPLAYRALEQALARVNSAGDAALARAKLRLSRLVARRLPYQLREVHALPPPVELALYELTDRARSYGARRRYLVTSGTRGPYRQARAMFVKLVLGSRLVRLYGQKRAAREIVRAFRAGRRAREPYWQVVGRMQRVIEQQVCRGVYISQHLKAGAVDLRSIGVSRRDSRALRRAARALRRAVYLKRERRPPHFHLSFRRLGRGRRPSYCPAPPRPDPVTGRCQSSTAFVVADPPVSR